MVLVSPDGLPAARLQATAGHVVPRRLENCRSRQYAETINGRHYYLVPIDPSLPARAICDVIRCFEPQKEAEYRYDPARRSWSASGDGYLAMYARGSSLAELPQ